MTILLLGVYEGSAAFADINNDGQFDVLVTGFGSSGRIAKLFTNSGTNFTEVFGTTFTGVHQGSIAFSDVNGDDKLDVLITGLSVGSIRTAKLYTNSETNFTEVFSTPFNGVHFSSIAFSDVNGDDKPDVLITGSSSSGLIAKLYTNSGTNFTQVVSTPFTPVYNSSIAFSNVNSDLNPDVLITGQDAIGNRIANLYTNNGTNFTKVVGTSFIGVDQVL